MSEFALYMHAGSGNHGCEAIVDSMVRMMPADTFRLMTNSAAEDARYLPPEVRSRIELLQERHMESHFVAHVAYYLYRMLTKDRESFLRYRYQSLTGEGRPRLAVSIGGDNYCYPSMVEDLCLANAMFNRQGTATVLLGCSIEPELLLRATGSHRSRAGEGGGAGMPRQENPPDGTGAADGSAGKGNPAAGLLEDLNRYRLIIARESITYEALQHAMRTAFGQKGMDKVVLCPDPAFVLPVDESRLPEGLEPGNTVGINVSPMAGDYAADAAVLYAGYEQLIRHILDTTGMKVALIPHVVWERSDDRVPLKRLYERFSDTGRVLPVEDLPAEQLKGVIANCRFMVGARTHATIAAYSTLIPTLVVGYSVKARGIARDLFGTEEHYVLPVQTLRDPRQLTDAWDWLFSHEDEIRCQLAGMIPKLRAGAGRNADCLQEVMQGL